MFLTYIYRELRRRHRQALLTATGLAVGVALVVAVSAYADGVGQAQSDVLQSLYGVGTDISVSQSAELEEGERPGSRFGMNAPSEAQAGEAFSRDDVSTQRGRATFAAVKLEQLSAVDGVAAVTASLELTSMHIEGTYPEQMSFEGGGMPTGEGQGDQGEDRMSPVDVTSYAIAGVDLDDLSLGPLSSAEIVDGRQLTSGDASSRLVVLDQSYAIANEIEVGDTMTIDEKKHTVVGVIASQGGSATADLYLSLEQAQKLAGEEGAVNQIYIKAESADQIAAVKASVQGVLPKATVTTAQDLADQVSGSLSSASDLADRLGTWIALAALVAAFLVASLLTVSAVSRRVREFGTLKALGWRSRRVVGQVLGEAVVQGVVGGLLGAGLGVAAARLIAWLSPDLQATVAGSGQDAMRAMLQGGGPGGGGGREALEAATQTVSVPLTAPVSPQLVLLAVALALAGGVLAGAFGGWRAARLRPADALRRLD